MSFNMPEGARDYLGAAETTEGVNRFTQFDLYYCCLMVGLDARRLGREEERVRTPFANEYPEENRSQADIIAGLLIDAELERTGIVADNKDSIEKVRVRLLDPMSPTRLSTEAEKVLDLYAAGGFRLLAERCRKPDSLREFLVDYQRYWREAESE